MEQVTSEGKTHTLYNADNLVLLNELIDSEASSVDFCYIDPPYNTGNTTTSGFTYHDEFKATALKNSHALWTDFMRPRLQALKLVLKPSGVVAISIDDSEVHYLRLLCDEIFGENNFIAQIIVDGGTAKNNARFVSTSHEYLLVYANNMSHLLASGARWRVEREGLEILRKKERTLRKEFGTDFNRASQELKTWLKASPLSSRLKVFYTMDERGIYTYADLSSPSNGHRYTVNHPITGLPCNSPSRGWIVPEAKFAELVANNMVIFGKDEKKQPLKKLYLKDGKDQVLRSIISFPSRTSTHLLEKLLGRRSSFNNPKNLDFIEYIIDAMCPDDGVVLDFFAGSGTTGHAVLNLNRKKGNSERTFILCTNNENGIYDEVCAPRIKASI
jgi:adenine-specific DNA-methyltransferase